MSTLEELQAVVDALDKRFTQLERVFAAKSKQIALNTSKQQQTQKAHPVTAKLSTNAAVASSNCATESKSIDTEANDDDSGCGSQDGEGGKGSGPVFSPRFQITQSWLDSTLAESTYEHDDFKPKVAPIEETSENEKRMYALAESTPLPTAVFWRCPSDYYDWELEQRRDYLNAPTVHYLCKTIVMANTKCNHGEFSDMKNSKYYMIIVQYSARLHNEKIIQTVRGLYKDPAQPAPAKKHFNFRLCSPEDNERLTGYTHNGVSPLGSKERLPIIISHKIAELNPAFFWLGAGEVDLKLRLSFKEFLEKFQPLVADITY